MNPRNVLPRLPVLLLQALLCGVFAVFASSISRFTILRHAFKPGALPLALWSLLFLVFIIGLWILFAKVSAGRYSAPAEKILTLDLLTWLPLLALSLTPLALRHYLTRADLLGRMKLLALAAIAAIVYLKIILVWRIRRWKGIEGSRLAARFSGLPPKKKLAALFAVSLIVFNLGAWIMISRGVTFGGDEPHYLLISHSLLQDGDFDLSNNYAQRDYEKYMGPVAPLAPHVVPGSRPGTQYSFHSPGVSLLLLPFYAAGSAFGGKALLFAVRLAMSLFGALFGLQIFLFARKEWKKENLALVLWALCTFTSPVYFYSIHVYPEIVVALLSLAVFRILKHSDNLSKGRWFMIGLLLSFFMWLHALKYLFILAPLGIYALGTLLKKSKSAANAVSFFGPIALITAVYFAFQYALYGSLNPAAVSWQGKMSGSESVGFAKTLLFGIPLRSRLETLAGYFLCQKDGLLFYAPLYVFSFLGAVEMWRRKRKDFWLLVLIAAPYFLNSAFLTQRTGYAPQARPLVATIWGFGIALGFFLAAERKRLFAPLFRCAAAVSVLFVALLCLHPFHLYQETTRGSTERGGGLFYLLSNLHFQVTKWLPSYIKVEEWRWWPNLIWPALLVAFIAAYALARKPARQLLYNTHIVIASSGMLLFFLGFVLYPRLVLMNPVNSAFPTGERITYYSLSRVARMAEPGKFLLPEDNRPYHFLFTSRREIEKLRTEFGSTGGAYSCSLTMFDAILFDGRTDKEVKILDIPTPARYKWKKTNLYWLTIIIGRGEGVRTSQSPYLFSFSPAR